MEPGGDKPFFPAIFHLSPMMHMRKVVSGNANKSCVSTGVRNRGYLFFSVKDQNLFHPENIIGNIFTSGCAARENITDDVHEMK